MAATTRQTHRIQILGNQVVDNGSHGIVIGDETDGVLTVADMITDCLISDNTIHSNSSSGIYIQGKQQSQVGEVACEGNSRHIIKGNTITNNGAYGILNYGYETVIASNTIDDNTVGAISDSGTGTLFENILGYTQITTSFATATVGSYVDVTDLSVTVSVPAGRRIKLTTWCGGFKTTAAAGQAMELAIREGETIINKCAINEMVSAYNSVAEVIAVISPSAGSHTYKVSVAQTAGAGTLTVQASDGTTAWVPGPAFILAEAL